MWDMANWDGASNIPNLTEEEQLSLAIELSKKEKENHDSLLALKALSYSEQLEIATKLSLSNHQRPKSFFERYLDPVASTTVDSSEEVERSKVRNSILDVTNYNAPATNRSSSASRLPDNHSDEEDSDLLEAIRRSKLETFHSVPKFGASNVHEEFQKEFLGATQEVKNLDELELEMQFQRVENNSGKISPRFDSTSALSCVKRINKTDPPSRKSKNSSGDKIPCTKFDSFSKKRRPIVVDGCNVAYQHGKNDRFSAKGLMIVYDHLVNNLGYDNSEITIVNKPLGKKSQQDLDIIDYLYKIDVLVNTPKRYAGNKLIVSDDDLFILNLAKENGGIVVSLDNYRDAYERTSDPGIKNVIENRILQFVFKGDKVIFPSDPLGPGGPSLRQFLST